MLPSDWGKHCFTFDDPSRKRHAVKWNSIHTSLPVLYGRRQRSAKQSYMMQCVIVPYRIKQLQLLQAF